jgi:hypothetical protein
VSSADERHHLLSVLIASGRLSSARILGPGELAWGKPRGIEAAIEGDVELDGRRITLRVGLCARFPLVLPQIFVVLADVLGTIPHVERDGWICYLPTEGLLIDDEAPLQVLEEALEAAIRTVADGVSGNNGIDFLEEIEAYWQRFAEGDSVPCYVEPDDRLRRVYVGRGHHKGRPSFIADSFSQVEAFENGRSSRPPSLQEACYVPLARSVLQERFTPRQFESLDWTRSFVLKHLSEANLKELERLEAKTAKRTLVVFGVPRPKGG